MYTRFSETIKNTDVKVKGKIQMQSVELLEHHRQQVSRKLIVKTQAVFLIQAQNLTAH